MTDLFGNPLPQPKQRSIGMPLLELMTYPDAIWLCRMGTDVDEAVREVMARQPQDLKGN